MTHVLPLLLLFILLFLTSSSARASILCPWTRFSTGGGVHRTFLREENRVGVPPPGLRLYHAVWTGPRALRACAWTEDAAVVQSYRELCRERARDFSHAPEDDRYDLEAAIRAGRCVPGPVDAHLEEQGSEVSARRRVRRGFIVPGTLWCGSGNKAPSYADLGVFSDTDGCCREHDQCQNTILSFHSGFGVFNSNIFTMSHCDCDHRFRSCLRAANDSIADVVGYTFFNLLKMHCFTFSRRPQCKQRNWFGMCKETQMALYADVHPPTLYESEGCSNSSCTITTAPPQPPQTPAPPQITSPPPQPPQTSAPPRPKAGPDPLENALPARQQVVAQRYQTDEMCSGFRELDRCRGKIGPQETKYGVHNPESTTLFHCNCTRRLFQALTQQGRLTEVQGLLLALVSPACFLDPDCSAGSSCAPVVVRAELPLLDMRSSAGEGEQRPLEARRLNSRRKGRPVRLHRLCARMSRPKGPKGARRGGGSPWRRRLRANHIPASHLEPFR
ncbi:group 3 secretory phospholipase A2 isoform 1-T1 [Menidia menidia]